MTYFKRTVLFVVSVLLSLPVHVSGQNTNTGMDFLNVGPSAYNLGLSEAGVAGLQGPGSMYLNPANVVRGDQSVLQADYTDWILDSRNSHASALIDLGNQAFSAGFYNASIPEIEAREQNEPSQGTFPIEYLTIAGSYSYQYKNFSAGVTAQYLNESYLVYSASGYAFNTGITGSFLDERLNVGISVLNLGKMQKLNNARSELPANLRAGIKVQTIEFNTPGENDFPVLITTYADYVQPLKNNEGFNTSGAAQDPDSPYANLALEIHGADLFSVRTGFKTGSTDRPWTVGAGLHIDPVVIDYALIPFSTGFSTSHTIGVRYSFDW